MNKPLRLLLVEDSQDDAQLVLAELLRSEFDVVHERVETADAMASALARQPWDIVLADYSLPYFSGAAALKVLQASGHDLPFIIVAGASGEQAAVEMMKNGARDYLLKQDLRRLGPAVRRELRETATRNQHKQAEKIQQLQNAALQATANGIVITDRNGTIEWVNPAFCALTGYTLAEAVGRNPRDLVKSGQVRRAVFEELWQTILAGNVWRGKLINRRKDGSLYTEVQTITPVRNDAGEIVHFIGIKQDLTAQSQAEEMARKSEERYRLLFEKAPDAIMTIAPSGKISSVNHAFGRITGWPGELWLGRRFRELLHPDDVTRALEIFQKVLHEGATPTFEVRMRTAAGAFIDTEITGFLNQLSDGSVEVQGIGRDITQRKTAERQLREQHEIISQSREAVVISTDDNQVTFWNHGAEVLFGWTQAEALGRDPAELLNPADFSIVSALRAAVQAAGHWSGEVRTRGRDGPEKILECHVTLVRDATGRPIGRLNVMADVTEKKLTEAKFLHAQRLESLGMLAAGIAHDLNNVLAPIMFVGPLLRQTLSDPRDLKILHTLEQSAERGAGLVKQILGFVHANTGEFQPTQVKHIARDIINVIDQTFPKSIAFQHNIPSVLWPVVGNATQIHQVLLNLCVNARDAMPQGGTLRFAMANRRLDEVEAGTIPGAQPGAWLELEVSDTGTGIPPEELKRIWDPFFTTKGAGRGTGLGLSTVRGIVASHHGFIALHTAVGRGTTFRVFLPAVDSDSQGPDTASPFAHPAGHGELVLVVDDEAAIRELVTAILGKSGYRVQCCSAGDDALAWFATHFQEVSLVITDLDMPRIGGAALVRALSQLRPNLQLIVMSGLARNKSDGTGAFEAQKLAHAFLPKPFSADDLLNAVNRLLHPTGVTFAPPKK